MGTLSLVALDTDHIKRYVFATDKLKEIRGASSLLDHLNRHVMLQIAVDPAFRAQPVFTNGGSGLFLLDTAVARAFALRIQQAYQRETMGGASITFAIQELPEEIQNTEEAWRVDLSKQLQLLRYRLAEKKLSWLAERTEPGGEEIAKRLELDDCAAFASHPFMRSCDACGLYYAEGRDRHEPPDEAALDHLYCAVCLAKREEDSTIKNGIDDLIAYRRAWLSALGDKSIKAGFDGFIAQRRKPGAPKMPFAWQEVLKNLPPQYSIPSGTERPGDFNELRGMAVGAREYLAVIYADGNNMGQMLEQIPTLNQLKETAFSIDQAIYTSIGSAIGQYLHIQAEEGRTPLFPFDLLLVGGDDLMIVTPADKVLDVALAIAREFQAATRERDPKKKGYSLSVGVVLAPVKYPFGLLQKQVDETLQYAKKAAENRRVSTKYGETFINFMTVTGSTNQDFEEVYHALHRIEKHETFYGSLRPYTVEGLELLLKKIREGRQQELGRSKLHQVREAVLKMNMTTSVYEGLIALRTWQPKKRDFVTRQVYEFAALYQQSRFNREQPGTLFPRVTFPWFVDGPRTYRTPLLDFVELYDFVAGEERADEN